jgi:hypothetical protein
LNIQFIDGGGSQPPPPQGTPQSMTGSFEMRKGDEMVFNPMSVMQGTRFVVSITGSGDADLYVRFGAAPTASSYACRPYLAGSNESCELEVPAGQTQAFVQLRGYAAASGTINAEWTAPSSGPAPK